jgi:Zn-dependent peptidase ImmA (M78 family)
MKINPEQLILARHVRQLSQKEVAEKTNISQGKLSKAEQGIQELSSEMIDRLATFYDFPLSFFCLEKDESPVAHQYFRRKLTIPAKTLDHFIAQTQIYKMCIDVLLQDIELPEMRLPFYQVTERLTPTDIAQKVRYNLGVFRGPVPNLTTLLENNGIIIIKFDFGTDKLDGLTSKTNNNHLVIFLNSQMPNDRTRFSLAHELGHLIMHLNTSPDIDEVENEANEFASEFLLPQDEIQASLHNLKLPTLMALKKRWNVSMRAIIRRARDLGTISDYEYRQLQILFSKKHYNKQEPCPLLFEEPNILKYTLKLHKDDLNYTDAELAKVMHLNEHDYFRFMSSQQRPIYINWRKK